MFGFGRNNTNAIEKRARLIARMVVLVVQGLQTKSYEQFVSSYTNPGSGPNPFEQSGRQHSFIMHISPDCWYNVLADYADEHVPSVRIQGGGDDLGVHIVADARPFVTVELSTEQKPGRDARKMVDALHFVTGWKDYASAYS